MNHEREGFFGMGMMTFITPLVGIGYRRKSWKKVDTWQAARQVRERLRSRKRVDAMAEAWLRSVFWKLGKVSDETYTIITAGWAATTLQPDLFGVLREGLRLEHQTWTKSINEALLAELLIHVPDLDASLLTDLKFQRIPFEMVKRIQSELRLPYKQVLESDYQPLDDDVWAIEDACSSKEPGPEEQLLRRESEIAEFMEAAGLGPQERELIQAYRDNPDLLDYGGNKELAGVLQWSTQQVAVVKKRAFDKLKSRQVTERRSA